MFFVVLRVICVRVCMRVYEYACVCVLFRVVVVCVVCSYFVLLAAVVWFVLFDVRDGC